MSAYDLESILGLGGAIAALPLLVVSVALYCWCKR